jgi:alkylation response protein AidB-like acyl-CoA dehydrogenase
MDQIVKSGNERLHQLLCAVSERRRSSANSGSARCELEADLDWLRGCGAFAAAFPERFGGLGLGSEPQGAFGLFEVLRRIGSYSLSLGRVYEGHVNAIQLVVRYGNEAQIGRAAKDAHAGHLFAIWNTEAEPGLRLGANGRLAGGKIFCSAAGLTTRPVVTVDQRSGGRLLVVELAIAERANLAAIPMHGMRGTRTGAVDFDGYAPDLDQWIGEAGDYLRQPLLAAGAWRTLAVIAGGLETLVNEICAQLRSRGRDAAPLQRARVASLLIDQETARLWVHKCADLADGQDYQAPHVAAYVNLARRAVEAACLDAIQLAQRCVGLPAFLESNPLENLMRDLSTYLRQPALDIGLDEAAATFMNGSSFDDHVGSTT